MVGRTRVFRSCPVAAPPIEISTIRPPDIRSDNYYQDSNYRQSAEQVVSAITPIKWCGVSVLPARGDQNNHKDGRNENPEVHSFRLAHSRIMPVGWTSKIEPVSLLR